MPDGQDKDTDSNSQRGNKALRRQKSKSKSSKKKVKVQRESVNETIGMVGEGLQKLQATSSNEEMNITPERYLTADMDLVKVDTRRNIATVLLGQEMGEALLDFCIYKGIRGVVISVSMAILWFIGHIVGLITLFGVLPPDFGILGGLLALPGLVINCYSLLIIDVLKMLLIRFDTYYLMYNVVTVVVSLSLMLKDNRAVWICTGVLLSGLWSTLADAMPTGMRRITTIGGMGFAVVGISAIQAGLYFEWIEVEEARYVVLIFMIEILYICIYVY